MLLGRSIFSLLLGLIRLLLCLSGLFTAFVCCGGLLPALFPLLEVLALPSVFEFPHLLGRCLVFFDEGVPLLVHYLVVGAEHSLGVGDQSEEDVISGEIWLGLQRLLVHSSNEGL